MTRLTNKQDYANLSDHVYGDKNKQLVFDKGSRDKVTLDGITYQVILQKSDESTGYFGAVYRRMDTNELIVTHRGTEFDTEPDRTTDTMMVTDKTNRQYPYAKYLTEQANEWAANNNKDPHKDKVIVSQTGHSLGGTLAQLCGNNFEQKTETFNPFGSGELKELVKNKPHSYQLITNHMMGGDFVSSASPQIGRNLYYAKPEEIRHLQDGGYGDGNPKNNTYLTHTIPGYVSMPAAAATSKGPLLGVYSSHTIKNFTNEHGNVSVLSPHSHAQDAALKNSALIQEFRSDVLKTAHEKPQEIKQIIDKITYPIDSYQEFWRKSHPHNTSPSMPFISDSSDSTKAFANHADMMTAVGKADLSDLSQLLALAKQASAMPESQADRELGRQYYDQQVAMDAQVQEQSRSMSIRRI